VFTYISAPTTKTYFVGGNREPIYPYIADSSVERLVMPAGLGNRVTLTYDGTAFYVVDSIGNITVETR
jgi:hypothetical protein